MSVYDREDLQRKRLALDFSNDPGLTKQSFRDECDINVLMDQYQRTKTFTHISAALPQYGDFSNVLDYQAAVNQVKDAQAAFAELPSHIRDRFANQPAELLRFMDNPENLEEGRQLGLYEEESNPVPTARATGDNIPEEPTEEDPN